MPWYPWPTLEDGDTPPFGSFSWLPLVIFAVAALAALVLFVGWRERRTWPGAVGTGVAAFAAVAALGEFVIGLLNPLGGLVARVGWAVMILFLLLVAGMGRLG